MLEWMQRRRGGTRSAGLREERGLGKRFARKVEEGKGEEEEGFAGNEGANMVVVVVVAGGKRGLGTKQRGKKDYKGQLKQ